MYFRCQHCDQPFESADERPRCPRCMRITSVVPLGTPGAAPAGTPEPKPYRKSRPLGERVPWTVTLGVGMLGASAVAAVLTDFDAVAEGERMGLAIGFAAAGGAGLALALWGLRHLFWRR